MEENIDNPVVPPPLESFFALFLTALQEKIQADMPDIKWIDQDMQQLEIYETRPPVLFPCLLIDFDKTTYDQEGNRTQWGNSMICMRLGFSPFSASNSAAPFSVKTLALQYYEMENRLFRLLDAWAPVNDICQPIVRIQTETEKRNDGIRVRKIYYTTTFEDDGALPVKQSVPRPMPSLDFT